jgi:hypothetical protein
VGAEDRPSKTERPANATPTDATRSPKMAALLLLCPFVLLGLLGCLQTDPWVRRDDQSTPTIADTSDCHMEARRLATAQYPRQVNRFMYGTEDERRFPAEISIFEQCMRRTGFTRAGPSR